MDVTIYSANPSEFEHESNQLMEIAEVLKAAEPADKPVWMITNVLLGNKELDCILLTEKGPIIIDCKAYQGKITGCENGIWEVQTPSGNSVEMHNNPFEQSRNQRFTFIRKWGSIVEKHFKQQIPEKQIPHFSNWVYFKSGSEHVDNRLDYANARWFKVVTKENLVSEIEKLNRQYRISVAGYGKILHEFGLKDAEVIDVSQIKKPVEPDDDEEIQIEPEKEDITDLKSSVGPIPLIIQKGVIRIILPVRKQTRTPEFLDALDQAIIFSEKLMFEKALNLINFALDKDPYDMEAQDLKCDILCQLGRSEEAEEYLIITLKG